MRRIHTLAAVFAAISLCAFAVAAYAQDDVMTLKAVGGQRGVVKFTHAKHQGYGLECTSCHHKYDPKQPGKNLWEMGDETSCAACHSGAKAVSKIGLQQANHKLCWGCHEKQPADKKLAFGPRSCAGCHEVK